MPNKVIPQSFAVQLTLTVVGVLLLSQIAFTLHTSVEHTKALKQSLLAQSNALAKLIARKSETALSENQGAHLESLLNDFTVFDELQTLQIFRPSGEALTRQVVRPGHSVTTHPDQGPMPLRADARIHSDQNGTFMVLWEPIGGASTVAWLRLGFRLDSLTALNKELHQDSLIAATLALILSVSALLVFLRRPLQNIKLATKFARELQTSNGQQLKLSGTTTELETLIHALNDASTSLAHSQSTAIKETSKLRASEARSRAILRTMRDGVIQIDDHGIMLAVNDVIEDIFGYRDEELIGQNISMLMPTPHKANHNAYLANYRQTRERKVIGKRREFEGLRKDGSTFPLDLSVNEMIDDAGSTFIGVIRDISEQKDTLKSLEDALLTARAATDAKTRFLANMSHEIRTPINAILGFSHLGLNLDLPVRARSYIEKIQNAAQSLLGIINDVLDFSKIEAGKLELEHVSFKLSEVLFHVDSLFNLKAREKGVELVIGTLPGIPSRLMGDPLRLGQVLVNLVSNALKFTERGEVCLTVEPANIDLKNARCTLKFSVQDTGLGMTPEQQSRLFNAFTQADNSTTRKFGGSGLGLAICKQLVEQMNGSFEVSSEAGSGSCFTFTATFNLTDNDIEIEQPLERSPLFGKNILVVDDNAVMRTLMNQLVSSFGCHVETLETGESALERITTGPSFDLILLDWHMKDLDGLAVAARIRAAGHRTPIILITGDEPESARAQMVQDQIQAILSKPISHSTLRNTMIELSLGQGISQRHSSRHATLPALDGKTILLVDDNDFNRQVGTELIELTGATVETAVDGKMAVESAARTEFDLILMDLQMPVMDGYVAARIIRESRPELPILALTAHAMVEERVSVLAAGMNDILTKPILPDSLYSSLEHWLKTPLKPNTHEEQPPAPRVDTPDLTLSDVSSDDGVLLDVQSGLSRVNNNMQMLQRFMSMFLERNQVCMTELGSAIMASDFVTAHRLAHTIKGSAGTIGALSLQSIAKKLEAFFEDVLAHKTDQAPPEELLSILNTTWDQTQSAIKRFLTEEHSKPSKEQGDPSCPLHPTPISETHPSAEKS